MSLPCDDAPLIGFRYKANEHLYPFFEPCLEVLSDTQNIAFAMGEKATDYNFIAAGYGTEF